MTETSHVKKKMRLVERPVQCLDRSLAYLSCFDNCVFLAFFDGTIESHRLTLQILFLLRLLELCVINSTMKFHITAFGLAKTAREVMPRFKVLH